MAFKIRKMVEKDIEEVQQVAKMSWHDTYEGIIPLAIQEDFLKAAYNEEMLHRRLTGSFMFVSEIEEKVVGFANFTPVSEDGKVDLAAIYLDPAYQGKGIGTALLQTGIQNIAGITEVFIDVEKGNGIGMMFYIAKGFEVVSEFDDNFDGHILKTVRMVLKISNLI